MFGLSARWSLAEAPEGVEQALREYVAGPSLERFSGMAGLRFKTWRMRPGEWFEGTYVWETAAARDEFADAFVAGAPTAPVTQVVGSPPVLVEPWEAVAVAEGGSGFATGPGPGSV